MSTNAINASLENGEAFNARDATGRVAPDDIAANLGAAASGVTMALNFQRHRAQRCSQEPARPVRRQRALVVAVASRPKSTFYVRENAMKSRMQTLGAAVSAMALAVAAPGAGAVDVGVGVSLNNVGSGSGGYGVSLPLRFGNITVEPDLSFYDFTSDTTYPSLPTNNSSSDNSQLALETGVYWRQQMVPSLEMYVGGRVGYSQNDSTTTYASGTVSKVTEEGFYLGPTLGAEYFFNPHFSLGLDVSLLFGSFSAEYSTNGVVTTERDTDRIDYQTRAKLRFYF